jgi:hypothetical protein
MCGGGVRQSVCPCLGAYGYLNFDWIMHSRGRDTGMGDGCTGMVMTPSRVKLRGAKALGGIMDGCGVDGALDLDSSLVARGGMGWMRNSRERGPSTSIWIPFPPVPGTCCGRKVVY